MTHTRSEVKTSLTCCQNMNAGCIGCAHRANTPADYLDKFARDALKYIMELATGTKQLKEVPPNGNA